MVDKAGVDTWSLAWYLPPSGPCVRAMEALATVPGPRSRLLEESVEDHRVGWFPGSRLLFVEGRPGGDGLARPGDLPAVAQRVRDGLVDRGVVPPRWPLAPLVKPAVDGAATLGVVGESGFAGVRRLDATVDLPFARAGEGLAFLAGVSALPLPRCKTEVVRESGGRRIETVYLRGPGGKTVLGRCYDKGVESGVAERGKLVRPEDQRRFTRAFRPNLEHVSGTSFVRDSFVRRFEPLWKVSKGVLVAEVQRIAERVGELVQEGELSEVMAEKVVGYLVLDAAGVGVARRATGYRRKALCRELGLVLADGVLESDVEVDLSEILERAFDSAAWGEG